MLKRILIGVTLCALLASCSAVQAPIQADAGTLPGTSTGSASETDDGQLPDSVLESYYLPSDDPVYSYLQNNSIKKFFDMWVASTIDPDLKPVWNYETLAPVQLLDHDFKPIGLEDEALYTCTFTADGGRCGYIIVSYGEEGPHISNWSLHETTPYPYDLRAAGEEIAAALAETDIDLSTASAARVEWIDTDKRRGDRVILFTDGKGDRYLCFLGDGDYSIEKR